MRRATTGEVPSFCMAAGSVTVVGDSQVVCALIDAVTDDNAEVRLEAVKALAHVASHGDQDAIEALAESLDDDYMPVRPAAVRALAHVGRLHKHHRATMTLDNKDFVLTPSHEATVEHLLSLMLPKHSAEVRVEAAEGLSQVLPRGHEGGTDALVALLLDKKGDAVGEAALSVKSTPVCKLFGPKSNPDGGREHDNEGGDGSFLALQPGVDGKSLRQAAAIALGKVAAFGNTSAQKALLVAVADSSAKVRAAALASFVAISSETTRDLACSTVLAGLKDPDAQVRETAVMWLVEVADSPSSDGHLLDTTVISAATLALEDESTDVRRHAAQALACLSLAGDEKTLRLLHPHLEDADWSVRSAATDAIKSLLQGVSDQRLVKTFQP